MRKILVLLICAIIFAISGCKENPIKPIVIDKNQEDLINVIDDSNKYSHLTNIFESVPKEVSELAFGDDIKIVIDANTKLPECSNIPVYIAVPSTIQQEQADRVLDFFCNGMQMYKEVKELTKSDYEELIIELKANINDPNSDWREATLDDPEEYQKALNAKTQELEKLEELLSEAPYEAVQEEASKTFHKPEHINQSGMDNIIVSQDELEIYGYIPSEKSEISFIHIINGTSESSVFYKCLPEYDAILPPIPVNYMQNVFYLNENIDLNICISSNDAIDIAEKALIQMGIEGYSLAHLGTGNIFSPRIAYEQQDQYYRLVYTRTIDSLSLVYDCKSISLFDSYSKPIPYEKIVFCINDDGILQFEWITPMDIESTISDNVEILDFSSIIDIFKQQVLIHQLFGRDMSSRDNKNNIESKTIEIDLVTLGYERIKKQDSDNEYLIVPAWNFYGTETTIYNQEMGRHNITEMSTRLFAHSYLTINAIDGSIINRELGY